MPLSGPSAAVRNASLSSSTEVGRLDVGGEVDDAHGRGRHAQAEPVELALEVRDHEGQCLGRAGRRRDDVLAGAPGAARVLVCDVEDALVVGVAVDRVHQAALDRQQVVDDLGRRREAVRRAAGVADDVVGRRVVAIFVDAEDDRDVLVLGRGADDDLLGAGVDVRLGLRGIGEDARALEDDVDAEVAPRQGGRVALGQDLDLTAVDDDRRVAGPDVARVGAVRRVVLEQVRVHLRVDQVVDGHDLHVRGTLDEGLERLPTDPAEAVDTDACGHGAGPPGRDTRPAPWAGRERWTSERTTRSDRGAANVCRGSTRIVRRGHRTKGGILAPVCPALHAAQRSPRT